MGRWTEAYSFLCRCISSVEDEGSLRAEIKRGKVPWREVIELASRHLVSPALLGAFSRKALLEVLPDDVHAYANAVLLLNRTRNKKILEQLFDLIAYLNRHGVEPVLLKGAANLASGLYQDPGMRLVRDLDLLIPAQRLEGCVRALQTLGYAPSQPCVQAPHHYPILHRKGEAAGLELHWNVVWPPWDSLLPVEEVWEETQPWNHGVLKGHLLSPDHQVLHSVIHSLMMGSSYPLICLRDCIDFAHVTRQGGHRVNWTRIESRFEAQGHAEVFHHYLKLCARLSGQTSGVNFFSDSPTSKGSQRRDVAKVYGEECLRILKRFREHPATTLLNITRPRWYRSAHIRAVELGFCARLGLW